MFRSRNHLPRSPSRLPLRLPGFARTAPSKQQAARKTASTTEFAAEKPGQPARSHRTWPSRTGTAHGRRTPASDALELFFTGSALAALQTGSVWPASSSPSSQRRGGGAGSSPNNDTPSCTSRTKVPGRGRGLSWPPSTAGARLAHGARPGLACNREQLLARPLVGLLGKSVGGVGRGSATAAGAGAGAGWSWSWGALSWSWEFAQRTALPPLNFLAWC